MFTLEYSVEVVSSIIRMCAPLLYCALAAAICSKAGIFNLSMDGSMTVAAFFSIVVNYHTGSVFLSVLAAMVSAMAVSALVGFLVIKLKANPVVVGIATNVAMGGVTTYLLYAIFKVRGNFTSPSLVGLPKIRIPFIQDIPFIGAVLSGITYVDLFSFVFAILLYLFLYKTVMGYRIRAIGTNGVAARSLGTPVDRYQFITITLSGILCGLGGVLLSMGTTRLFIENITSGRGYIALAANNLGKSHPIGVLISSLFFGTTEALGFLLQQTSVKGQVTASIPYVATILALMLFTVQKRHAKKKKQKETME